MPEPTNEQRIIDALERRLVNIRPGKGPRPIRALALARLCGLRPGGSRESRRRGVRQLIARLRKQGKPIVTDGTGYWLAQTPEDHKVHQDFLRHSGLTQLAGASRDARSMPAADARGQLRLF